MRDLPILGRRILAALYIRYREAREQSDQIEQVHGAESPLSFGARNRQNTEWNALQTARHVAYAASDPGRGAHLDRSSEDTHLFIGNIGLMANAKRIARSRSVAPKRDAA